MPEEKEKILKGGALKYPDKSLDPIADLGWLFVGSAFRGPRTAT